MIVVWAHHVTPRRFQSCHVFGVSWSIIRRLGCFNSLVVQDDKQVRFLYESSRYVGLER